MTEVTVSVRRPVLPDQQDLVDSAGQAVADAVADVYNSMPRSHHTSREVVEREVDRCRST